MDELFGKSAATGLGLLRRHEFKLGLGYLVSVCLPTLITEGGRFPLEQATRSFECVEGIGLRILNIQWVAPMVHRALKKKAC